MLLSQIHLFRCCVSISRNASHSTAWYSRVVATSMNFSTLCSNSQYNSHAWRKVYTRVAFKHLPRMCPVIPSLYSKLRFSSAQIFSTTSWSARSHPSGVWLYLRSRKRIRACSSGQQISSHDAPLSTYFRYVKISTPAMR